MNPRAAVKTVIGRLFPRSVLISGDRSRPFVALTFDDGPHPVNTVPILDILGEFGIPATFFLQGSEIVKLPEIVESILEKGHAVGNHGFHHRHWRGKDTAAFLDDVTSAQALIEHVSGEPQSRIFRPPYGEISVGGALRLLRLGYQLVFWSVDSRDSFLRNADAVVNHLQAADIRGGDVVLLHDDYRHTVSALPRIIEHIRQRDLAFRRVTDLLT